MPLFLKGERVQITGGNMCLGCMATVVEDYQSGWGKIRIQIDGYPSARAIDISRLSRKGEPKAGPIQPAPATSPMPVSRRHGESANELRQRILGSPYRPSVPVPGWEGVALGVDPIYYAGKEEGPPRPTKKQQYEIAKLKAGLALSRINTIYPTEQVLKEEEASIHYFYEVWVRKVEARKRNAYWQL